MATAFRPVNTPLPLEAVEEDGRGHSAPSPTTPTPSNTYMHHHSSKFDGPTTPNGANINGRNALASQRPLPTSPFPDSVHIPDRSDPSPPARETSQRSRKRNSEDDMDMDDSEGDNAHGEDGAGSDVESVNADGSRSNKKKKSQRFYCTDYPPCSLSFTRSEHLARHIRKHTGERPFQCHCSRRFSRLDNLRQHAQTVHVNEDIPIDSLAATGTRFQRQIRTDRVRQTGGRARSGTAGSLGPTGRGHSKSLSTSSIAAVMPGPPAYGGNDARRRPPPLVMADPRSRMPLEPYRPVAVEGQFYRPPSPSEFSTPTSATFSAGQNSPAWGPGVGSPPLSHARSRSMYVGARTPGRRLSVPSGASPFQSSHNMGLSRPGSYYGPGGIPSPGGAPFSPGSSSLVSSPTAPSSVWSRRESFSGTADEAWRRRTWHPDTRDYNGASRLSQVITQSQVSPSPAPAPIANPPEQSQQTFRLPGIESFDPLLPRPRTPVRRPPSSMMVDSDSPDTAPLPSTVDGPRVDYRRADLGLHRGLTRLDINGPPRESADAWAAETSHAVLARADHLQRGYEQSPIRYEDGLDRSRAPTDHASASANRHSRHHHTMSAPTVHTPPDARRHTWYHGSMAATPAGPAIPEGRTHDRIVHPNVGGFQGFPARDEPLPVVHQHPTGSTRDQSLARGDPDSLRRLEALVAVATSEGTTASAC